MSPHHTRRLLHVRRALVRRCATARTPVRTRRVCKRAPKWRLPHLIQLGVVSKYVSFSSCRQRPTDFLTYIFFLSPTVEFSPAVVLSSIPFFAPSSFCLRQLFFFILLCELVSFSPTHLFSLRRRFSFCFVFSAFVIAFFFLLSHASAAKFSQTTPPPPTPFSSSNNDRNYAS